MKSIILLCVFFVATNLAQVNEEWIQRYNGPGNSVDHGSAIVVDNAGNVYVTGESRGSGTNGDYATIKYNAVGEQQWLQRYNGPVNNVDGANAITLDNEGNVYVTGYSSGNGTGWDYATIKYNSTGEQQWVQRYNGTGNGSDFGSAIAIDNLGNVYVTGKSLGIGTDQDYATIKYNSAGELQWHQRYNGTGNYYDHSVAIAVDNAGNVYVTGRSAGNGSSDDYATIKYNSMGEQQWVKIYNGPGNSMDWAHSVSVDNHGNVYVTGVDYSASTGFDYATIKYNSTGEQQWIQRYNGPGNSEDYSNDLTVDNDGNVYVTGGSRGSGNNQDYATLKYNSVGQQQWLQRYNGLNNGDDYADDITVDDAGNVYITGYSSGAGTGRDYTTIKYNSAGEQQWVQRYNGFGSGDDWPQGIEVDDAGNVYITGYSSGNGTGWDYATIKYSQGLIINTPNGGDVWQINSTQNITWNSGGTTNVKLDYTTNNGVTWLSIVASTPSDGTYAWTVPNTPSTQCKVRITDVDNANISDESDNLFSIFSVLAPRVRLKINVPPGIELPQQVKFRIVDFAGLPISFRTKQISGGFVELTQNDLQIISSIGTPGWKFDRLELLGPSGLIGHIPFNYTKDDYDDKRRVDALLYLHTYSTNYLSYNDWDYYSGPDEKMVSMLIPPNEKFEAINYNDPLLLLVHGVDGEYPYWGSEFIDGLSNTYDSWQFYYPHNQEIESSGKLLRDALNILLETGPLQNGLHYSGHANVVAHSMGGLVTRSYIQSEEYNNDINKLAMLGTPNHGSYSTYRLRHEQISIASLFARIFLSKDEDAPAFKQMIPGSEFFYKLNSLQPKQLDPLQSINRNYLVVAGTKDQVPLHTEIKDQEDGVVALSSASLLNYGIPLASLHLEHSNFASDVPSNIVLDFFNNNYNPNSPLTGVDGWWGPSQIILPTVGPIDASRGIINMKIPGLQTGTSKYIELERTNNIIDLKVSPIFEGWKVLHRGEDIYNYFSEDKYPRNEIGLGFPENVYTLKFKFRIRNFNPFDNGWGTAAIIPNALQFEHLQTVMKTISLPNAVLTALNAGSQIQQTPVAISQGGTEQVFTLNRKRTVNQNIQITSDYLIDSSIDSLTVILNGSDSTTGFELHDLHLISPSSQLIDSTFAQNNPDMEFYQDITNRIAYYFVRNPEQGTWQVIHSDTVSGGILAVPAATDFNLNVEFTDSLFSAGQIVDVEIPLPQPIDYTNIQITGNIFQAVNGTDTLMLLQPINLTLDPGGLKYTGQFMPTTAGDYYVGINFNCQRSGETITRNLLEYFNVSAIAPPTLYYPANSENVLGDSVYFHWSTSPNASVYQLQIIVPTDTLPYYEQSNIVDTSFVVGLSADEEIYFWQVRALNVSDTSSWSELRSFTSLIPISTVPINVNPGWNMISNPVTLSSGADSVLQVFPNSSLPHAFAFTVSGYQQTNILNSGIGYWASFPDSQLNLISGTPRITDTIQVFTGWNLIGSISFPVDTSAIISTPMGIKTSNWFGYSGGYSVAQQINPGSAYWVNVSADGEFILSHSVMFAKQSKQQENILDKFSTINISDDRGNAQTLYLINKISEEIPRTFFQLPPLPPAGVFDTRFESGMMAEDLSSGNKLVLITGAKYPLTIKATGTSLRVKDIINGTLLNRLLSDGEEIIVDDSRIEKILVVGENSIELPVSYSLEQNYPNPFNPSTKIKFAIPKEALVKISVFNILGEKIKDIQSEIMKPGYYEVEFNASDYASGVYFYQLKSGDFVTTKKMMLIK